MKIILKGNRTKAARWVPFAKSKLQALNRRSQRFLQWRQKVRGNVIVHVVKGVHDAIYIEAGGDAIFAGFDHAATFDEPTVEFMNIFLYEYDAHYASFVYAYANDTWDEGIFTSFVEDGENFLQFYEAGVDNQGRERLEKQEGVYNRTFYNASDDGFDFIEDPPAYEGKITSRIIQVVGDEFLRRDQVEKTYRYAIVEGFVPPEEGVPSKVLEYIVRREVKVAPFVQVFDFLIPLALNQRVFFNDGATMRIQDGSLYFFNVDKTTGEVPNTQTVLSVWRYDLENKTFEAVKTISEYVTNEGVDTPAPEIVTAVLEHNGSDLYGYATVSFDDFTATPFAGDNTVKLYLGPSVADAELVAQVDVNDYSSAPADPELEVNRRYQVVGFSVLSGGLGADGLVDFGSTKLSIWIGQGNSTYPVAPAANNLPGVVLRWTQAGGFETVLIADPLLPETAHSVQVPLAFNLGATVDDVLCIANSSLVNPETGLAETIAVDLRSTYNLEERSNPTLKYLSEAKTDATFTPFVFEPYDPQNFRLVNAHRDDR